MATSRPRRTRAVRPCPDCDELTPNQRMVLDAVTRAGKPIGAYGVIAELTAGGRRVMPPTVYRALDGLTRQKLVHRLESLNAYVVCSGHDHAHDSLFVICEGCGHAEEFSDDESIARLTDHARSLGFEIESRMIELRGRCADCRRKQ
ncbi:MAG: transcriptional repressor [Rhodospirillales bacterium]|nr:transcriptional repressor [Rhodospirillales bacterium]